MEIKIDTKKDSVEDIKKTIDFLLKFIEHSDNTTSEIPTVGEGTFNLFNNAETPDTPSSDNSDDDDPARDPNSRPARIPRHWNIG